MNIMIFDRLEHTRVARWLNPFLKPKKLSDLCNAYGAIECRLRLAQDSARQTGKPLLLVLGEVHDSLPYITYALVRCAMENLGIVNISAVLERELEDIPDIMLSFKHACIIAQNKLNLNTISGHLLLNDVPCYLADITIDRKESYLKKEYDNIFKKLAIRMKLSPDTIQHKIHCGPTAVEKRSESMAQAAKETVTEQKNSPANTAILAVMGGAHIRGFLENYGLPEIATVLSFYTSETPKYLRFEEALGFYLEDLALYPTDPLLKMNYLNYLKMWEHSPTHMVICIPPGLRVSIPQIHAAVDVAARMYQQEESQKPEMPEPS